MPDPSSTEDVKDLLGRELQSANAVIMRQMAEISELREALAAVREYRIYIDSDGDGIRMHGPCAETIGCLFGRLFDAYPSMSEDTGLGLLIDAALEHERDKEQLHAAQMQAEGLTQRPRCLPGCDRLDGHDGRDAGACMKDGAELRPAPLRRLSVPADVLVDPLGPEGYWESPGPG
jgi:hypothetical protein